VTFNSLQYAVFLPVVFIIYWRLNRRWQNWLVLAASYVFYGAFDWRFLGLLMISTATDYTVGRVLERTTDDRRRKEVFACSLVVNLGILGFFKYWDFFTGEATRLSHHLGLHLSPPVIHILLPVGISFYTFHGMSYTFDVFRKKIEPTHSLLSFAVFVAFFPQLVAGPIGRAHLQLPQFERDRVHPDWEQTKKAVLLILQGLFKKVAIADALAPYVASAFNAPKTTGSATLIMAMLAFSLQIYGDFSGYSDIARGSAWLLGIDLPENFNQPYFSRSTTEMWRRWHISLSNWLRDYLYIPLGGNKGTELATQRNLMITMLLGGLWHGAATTFVVWGGIHGCLLVAERRFTHAHELDVNRPYVFATDFIPTVITFTFWSLALMVFRSANFSDSLHFLKGMVSFRSGTIDANFVLTLVFAALAILIIDAAQYRARDHTTLVNWVPAIRGATYGVMLLTIIVFSGGTPVPFIYFRF
jgi:alginate O-acetyltransferase complex protein AlgI